MSLPSLPARLLLAVLCTGWLSVAGAHDGDVNLDGQVGVADVLWGEQALRGERILAPMQAERGDVAPLVSGTPVPDGQFNWADVLVIQRMVWNLIRSFHPANQFNVGDSIGEGEAADGTIGEPHHETVWSTGYDGGDSVLTFNERFEAADPADYHENDAGRDSLFNHAVSGSVMADFAGQAQQIVDDTVATPTGTAGMVTIFLGNNDVCAPSLAEMTDPAVFEAQYRAGLDVLAAADATRGAQIQVAGIPAIYWLWNAKRNVFWCRVFAWPFVPCENLLDNPDDDCASSASREDPDNVYPGDGTNCLRRKEFHRIVRDTYNPVLRDVLAEYRDSALLPNAAFADLYDVRFDSGHVNGGDCFHPSDAGHALLADSAWCRTQWGGIDTSCAE